MVIAFTFNFILLLRFTIGGKYSNMQVLANKKAFRKYGRLKL
ncbi:MAG: hypothetical protein JWR09_2063 [Mucilaginibacter sp.]|nr:hypothetical protein [Mucilaginibacter sp.]